jgi:hypothetical protein
MALHRFTTSLLAVVVNTTDAACEEILYSEFTSGMVVIGTGITSLTWYVAPVAGGTYVPAYDYAGAAVAQTSLTAARAYPIPLALIGNVALKAVANAEGTIDVTLKA